MSMAAKKLGILHFKKRGLWRHIVLLEKEGGVPNGKDPSFILLFYFIVFLKFDNLCNYYTKTWI